jgi:hypothetical protein
VCEANLRGSGSFIFVECVLFVTHIYFSQASKLRNNGVESLVDEERGRILCVYIA